MLGFLSELYDAFRRVNGYAMSAVGVVLTVASFVWLPDTDVSARVLVPVALAVVLCVMRDVVDSVDFS